MAFLTPLFFSRIRKILAVIVIIEASLFLFMILLNAETWFFGQKYNGVKALAMVVPFEILGIVAGIFFWKNKKVYPLVIIWLIHYLLVIIGNHLNVL